MTRCLHILPTFLAAAAVLALAAFGTHSSGDAPDLTRRALEDSPAPPASCAVAPLGPAVLVGRAKGPGMEAAPETPAAGEAVVRVLGPQGPCTGIWLDVFGLGPDHHCWEKTDDVGRVHLQGVPYDGSVKVVVDGLPASPSDEAPVSRASSAIHGPETVIEIARTMPLRVAFRDAETGASLACVSFQMSWGGKEAPDTAPVRAVATRPGHYLRASVKAVAPPGLVAFDGLEFVADISRRATALCMVGTFRHEALVYLRAVDVDGRSVTDAEVAGIEVAGERVWGRRGASRDGELLRVHDVPFLRRERIRLLATRPSLRDLRWEDGEEWVEEVEDDRTIYDRSGLLQDDVWPTFRTIEPGFGAIAKGRLPGRIEEALVLTAVFDPAVPVRSRNGGYGFGTGHGDSGRGNGPKGDVEVRVEDARGRPIRAVQVWLCGRWLRSDLDGRAFFREVPVGERTVVLREPGWVKTRHPVLVRKGETTRTTLVEDQGGELLVRVLGEDGKPLTGACIEVPEYLAWADVEDGVQRIDVATNHRGERLLKRFPAGTAKIEIRWGRRRGEGKTQVVSGYRQTLEIRVPPKDE